MANIDNVQLPDGSSYNIVDNTSGFATQNYVDSAVSSVTKTTIGLGNVDNTSDLNKPISTATQIALDTLDEDKADKTDIATVESGTTASRAYSVGELVYVSGTLYRVKTAIASGATFTVGTNIEAKKVSDAIDAKVNTADLNYTFGTPNISLRTNYDANLTDVNNCPNGVCSATFSQHTPSGNTESLYVFSMAMNNDTNYCRQIAWSFGTSYIYTRYCYTGNWTAWTQLIPMSQVRNISATPDVYGNLGFLSGSVGIPISVVVHNSDIYPSAPFLGGGGSAWFINVKNASGQPITTEISISFVYIPL